jgi:hypothetical protein
MKAIEMCAILVYTLDSDNPTIRKKCPICKKKFNIEDEVVLVPLWNNESMTQEAIPIHFYHIGKLVGW